MQYKKHLEFHDANNHIVRLRIEITNRNHYPEFTVSGTCCGSGGQCQDSINPKRGDQVELLHLWNTCHLKNVGKIHNFLEHLIGVCERIEYDEKLSFKQAESKEERIKQMMEEEDIDEDMYYACAAYLEAMAADNLEGFEEAYAGAYSDDEEFAQDMAEQAGDVPKDLHWPYTCINWEQAAKELMYDYTEQDGFYFRNL